MNDNTLVVPDGHFVYHLKRAGVVMYVGYTGNLLARIGSHASRIKGKFDSVCYTSYPDAKAARAAEMADISSLAPALNIKVPSTRAATIDKGARSGKRADGIVLITFPCSQAFKETLTKLANAEQRTLSAWIRMQLSNTARRSIAARKKSVK